MTYKNGVNLVLLTKKLSNEREGCIEQHFDHTYEESAELNRSQYIASSFLSFEISVKFLQITYEITMC